MHSEVLRSPWAPVIDDLDFSQREVDWSSWFLIEEEDMGEGTEQAQIIYMFLSVLSELARERQWQNVFFSGDQFFAWRQDQPLVRYESLPMYTFSTIHRHHPCL